MCRHPQRPNNNHSNHGQMKADPFFNRPVHLQPRLLFLLCFHRPLHFLNERLSSTESVPLLHFQLPAVVMDGLEPPLLIRLTTLNSMPWEGQTSLESIRFVLYSFPICAANCLIPFFCCQSFMCVVCQQIVCHECMFHCTNVAARCNTRLCTSCMSQIAKTDFGEDVNSLSVKCPICTIGCKDPNVKAVYRRGPPPCDESLWHILRVRCRSCSQMVAVFDMHKHTMCSCEIKRCVGRQIGCQFECSVESELIQHQLLCVYAQAFVVECMCKKEQDNVLLVCARS